MTQEEKAKAYDKAIEELKGLLDGIQEEKCNIMEEDIIRIFPELKENEDEKIRKDILGCIKYMKTNYCLPSKYTSKQYDTWIDWLEKQSKKKLAWNEEDENFLERIFNSLNTYAKNGHPCLKSVVKDEIVWLESLKEKYTWKPSEEQIEAVRCAVLDVAKFSSKSEQLRLENEPYYKALVSLCDDLKKLR